MEESMSKKVNEYSIDLSNYENGIKSGLPQFNSMNPAGESITFTNRYMERNNKPYFGISGEFHFSRYSSNDWEDELIKMKMGGINIVATYVLWNHHEEIKGVYDWQNSKDLRRFLLLCKKHELDVIIRIGPWDHGEVRNGGFPDWLYSEPLVVRSNDPLYLKYVNKLFEEIGKQCHGLFYKDCGPIIGIQLENEYQHAGAVWEMTTGTSNEWIMSGEEGNEHIKELKKISESHEMVAPIYTGTGWGGAVADVDTVLPLWGGYAFWPWIFFDEDVTEHPITPEYIYRDYRKPTYNFDPSYEANDVPYAACEMGGGMSVFYRYRFQLPYKSIDAMTNIKVASGCNFLGYYVYHGGSNPIGVHGTYLNENTTPKISYDYQAPIGEYGQVRESYYRLKREHSFFTRFQETLCKMETQLPVGAEEINPEDLDTLRYSVKMNEDSGFVFINNYQDHVECKEKKNNAINLEMKNEIIRFPHAEGFDLAAEENCILPFNLSLNKVLLKSATVQLLDRITKADKEIYFFFQPKGMMPEMLFDKATLKNIKYSGKVKEVGEKLLVYPDPNQISKIQIDNNDGDKIEIYVLTSEESLKFWSFEKDGEANILFSENPILVDENGVRVESTSTVMNVEIIPGLINEALISNMELEKEGELLKSYKMIQSKCEPQLITKKINEEKYLLTLDTTSLANSEIKDIRLELDYEGDIGYAFYENVLINDNFSNGATWEIGMKNTVPMNDNVQIFISITPEKKMAKVKSDSPMAARSEENEGQIVALNDVRLQPVYEYSL